LLTAGAAVHAGAAVVVEAWATPPALSAQPGAPDARGAPAPVTCAWPSWRARAASSPPPMTDCADACTPTPGALSASTSCKLQHSCNLSCGGPARSIGSRCRASPAPPPLPTQPHRLRSSSPISASTSCPWTASATPKPGGPGRAPFPPVAQAHQPPAAARHCLQTTPTKYPARTHGHGAAATPTGRTQGSPPGPSGSRSQVGARLLNPWLGKHATQARRPGGGGGPTWTRAVALARSPTYPSLVPGELVSNSHHHTNRT
jgi:hypothetical protein